MTAQELIELLQREIKIHGNLRVYRSVNEGGGHNTIEWIDLEEPRDEFDKDDDDEELPDVFFKLY